MRRRLDVALVRRGLVASRSEAVRLIETGMVIVSGALADKPARLVGDHEPVELLAVKRWVGRGAEKLDHALVVFDVATSGRSALDAGSSTGGFTECLLAHGARRVLAIDVGTNQLHERLRLDDRVVSRERTDIRSVSGADLPWPCSLLVADLSFISLAGLVSHLSTLVAPEEGHDLPEMILLVKPQFEVGRQEASKARGVITDPGLHRQSLQKVTERLISVGFQIVATDASPVLGSEGNKEFLVHARRHFGSVGCSS